MNKKIMIILIVALVVSIAAYAFYKKKQKEKTADPVKSPVAPGATGNTSSQVPVNPSAGVPAQNLPTGKFPLRYGTTGKAVQFMQVIVGVKPDGVWGVATDVAMKRFFKIVNDLDEQITVPEFVGYALITSGQQKWPLKQTDTGNYVKALQIMLNVTIDGKFGAKTSTACNKALGHYYCTKEDFETLVQRMLNT